MLVKKHVSLHYVIHHFPECQNWTLVGYLIPTPILSVFQWVLFLNFVVEWVTVLCIWQAQRSGILSEVCCGFP